MVQVAGGSGGEREEERGGRREEGGERREEGGERREEGGERREEGGGRRETGWPASLARPGGMGGSEPIALATAIENLAGCAVPVWLQRFS
jgi:hypothetical protein